MKRIIVATLEAISCIAMIVTIIMCIIGIVKFEVPLIVLFIFMILISIDVCMETEGY